MKRICFIVLLVSAGIAGSTQDAVTLMQKIKDKLDKVSDYQARGKMKMNIVFIKAPVADVIVYYKKPGKMKIRNETGISLIPKGSVNINLSSIIGDIAASDIIDAGKDEKSGLRIVKVLPKDENAEVVLSTLYIDDKKLLVKKAKTTSKENGTYELEMFYNKYSEYGLADRVIFSFNTKEYKLPKGVAFDYESGNTKEDNKDKPKETKGTIEFTYTEYIINKGVPDNIFIKE